MVITSPSKDHKHHQHHHQRRSILSLVKKLLPYTLYALLPIAFLRFYFSPSQAHLPQSIQHPANLISTTSPSPPPPPPPSPPPSSPPPPPSLQEFKEGGQSQSQSQSPKSYIQFQNGSSSGINNDTTEVVVEKEEECDYTNGEWVRDEAGPQYNGSSCATAIKEGQNCIAHGRPDRNYLFYRWKPRNCPLLPRFSAAAFLRLLRHKHLAFVGDSMARNQFESLLCLLSSSAASPPPILLHRSGEDGRFRRWRFPSHNLTVSLYWSPFLVKGVEKSARRNYNKLFLDAADNRWASDLDKIDAVVLSAGHWFLHPAVFYLKSRVLGCHYCPGDNHTEIGFYGVFGKAVRAAVAAVGEAASRRKGGIDAVLATFSPAHFEGDWDKAGACPKTEAENGREVGWMEAEMRRVGVAEVEAAARRWRGLGLRVEALDVTRMSSMRPDGHPGPYMNPYPFWKGKGKGKEEIVQNDCVHWCLPGPMDTWNEILLEMIKRWKVEDDPATTGRR